MLHIANSTTTSKAITEKVVAYITQGDRLLVFRHTAYPEAGIRRYFFHLEFHGEAPATWRHYEADPSDGSPAPIEFEFFWVRLPDEVPELSGDQGALLSEVDFDG